MNTRRNWTLACAGLVLALAAAAPPARANLLVDPGFEANPLDTAANVLGNFTLYQGVWGVEVATITGVDGGVTPAQGSKMLRMVDDGLTTTQAFQTTDVSSYAALINSGTATVNASALFTGGPNLPAPIAAVAVQFFSAANYGSQIGVPLVAGLTLDGSANTWQPISASGLIPIGTTWLLTQVYYSDASLFAADGASYPGYVDAAALTITPEPASVMGLLVLAVATRSMRRR